MELWRQEPIESIETGVEIRKWNQFKREMEKWLEIRIWIKKGIS